MAGPGRPKKVMPDTEPVEGVEPTQDEEIAIGYVFVDYNSEGTIVRLELRGDGLYDASGTLVVTGAKEGTESGQYSMEQELPVG